VPIVLVNGSLHLCVEYRKLNAVARMDAYLMPRIDELIDQLGKVQWMLDITRGYWQVPLASESQPQTAFIIPFGLY